MITVSVSVRQLVEFILRSGDITTSSGLADPDAMQEGTRIHKKIQRSMGPGYEAEVSLKHTFPVTREDMTFELCVEGRADGIYRDPYDHHIVVDEIKGVYRPLKKITEPVPVHQAQAFCYAYILCVKEDLPQIGVQVTYCHIPTEEIKRFEETCTRDWLADWFEHLVQEYAKWMVWHIRWQKTRNDSIHGLAFPFPYRDGQFELMRGVYQSIARKKRLYIEAPTGVGKTLSTVYPAVMSMGEGLTEKIFYLTAKTITRTVAQEAFSLLEEKGLLFKRVTLTAKEKVCVLDKPECNPETCPRARGHFDRVNDAVFDLLTHEHAITRETILAYAEQYQVCPFEMGLDVSTWCDAIIGDYNYAFDPNASLKRFFATDAENPYVFLVDEAHNLVDRARGMYSAVLRKEAFLEARHALGPRSKKISTRLGACNKTLLQMKRETTEIQLYEAEELDTFALQVTRLTGALDEYLQNKESHTHSPRATGSDYDPEARDLPLDSQAREILLTLYFDLKFFSYIYETMDDKYRIYSSFLDNGHFVLRLACMDPSSRLAECFRKGRSAVLFSATLLPIRYYREQLAGRPEDYAVYAPSPFSTDHRLLMIARDVSTRYQQRGPAMYRRIAGYILDFVRARQGNYLVFFPSYHMLEDVSRCLPLEDDSLCFHIQESSMDEPAREEFLSHFQDTPSVTTIGLCVMGGIFSEGIDLKEDRLIGSVIVGTGLPMVCPDNELYRSYFDEKKGTGFSYAYQYPGMNKVLQAAGRVIRTTSDRGAILLLDERFLQPDYQSLFPREWFPYEIVDLGSMKSALKKFWDN